MTKNYDIIKASACYTGGGIYVLTGQIEDGYYFFSLDSFCDIEDIPLFSREINVDNEDEVFWDYDKEFSRYGVGYIKGEDAVRLVLDTLKWIIVTGLEGNYLKSDMQDFYNDISLQHSDEIVSTGQYEYFYKGLRYFGSELVTPDGRYHSDILAVFVEDPNVRLIDYIYGNYGMSEKERDEFIKKCILKYSED